MMTFRKARGFYLRELVANNIDMATYWRRIRAIETAERRAAVDQAAKREAFNAYRREWRAKRRLRDQLTQSVEQGL